MSGADTRFPSVVLARYERISVEFYRFVSG